MPMGERAWATSKGPRKATTVRLSAEADVLLEVAATDLGVTKTALATELLERWADAWLRANLDRLREAVAERRASTAERSA